VQEVVVKGIYNSAAKSVKEPICGFSIMCRLLLVMKHFAVYHNPERMGYLADEVSESGSFRVRENHENTS
jgi:hypothetical protein